jgi:hypothetical protein
MVRRRGIHLVVMAALGFTLWTFAGPGGLVVAGTDGSASASASSYDSAVVAPLAGLDAHAAIMRAPHDRTTVARAQRLVALVAVLVGAGLVERASRSDPARLDDLPVWSGWFVDPGLLRGPPTT